MRVIGLARARAVVVLSTTLLLAFGCSRTDEALPEPASTTAAPAATAAPPALRLVELARLDQPTAITAVPGTDTVLISERLGRVWRYSARSPDELVPVGDGPLLDLTSEVDAGPEEQGLLGLAVAPDGATMSVSFTGRDHQVRVRTYPLGVDLGPGRDIRVVPMPEGNTHGAGGLSYGPDGALYAGFGDGSVRFFV